MNLWERTGSNERQVANQVTVVCSHRFGCHQPSSDPFQPNAWHNRKGQRIPPHQLRASAHIICGLMKACLESTAAMMRHRLQLLVAYKAIAAHTCHAQHFLRASHKHKLSHRIPPCRYLCEPVGISCGTLGWRLTDTHHCRRPVKCAVLCEHANFSKSASILIRQSPPLRSRATKRPGRPALFAVRLQE